MLALQLLIAPEAVERVLVRLRAAYGTRRVYAKSNGARRWVAHVELRGGVRLRVPFFA